MVMDINDIDNGFGNGNGYGEKCTLMRCMNRVIDVTKCPLTLILVKNTNKSVKHEVKIK